jgi:hypothetical protein
MSGYNLFNNNEIFEIFKNYVKNRYSNVNEIGNFVIRKVGRIRRLNYIIDDVVDWWDEDISAFELEELLKKEIYTKAIFKNILEFSKIKKTLDQLSIKPDYVSFSKVYYINLEVLNSEEKLLRSLGYRNRRNISNAKNRLKKVSWEFVLINKIDEIFQTLTAFIINKHTWTLYNDKAFQDSILKALKVFEKNNMLDIFLLKINDEIASLNVIIKKEKIAFWWITGYNEKYHHYMPTRISIWFVLKHYLNQGFKEFNFMKGESEYKTYWTQTFYKLYRYEYYQRNLFKKIISLL